MNINTSSSRCAACVATAIAALAACAHVAPDTATDANLAPARPARMIAAPAADNRHRSEATGFTVIDTGKGEIRWREVTKAPSTAGSGSALLVVRFTNEVNPSFQPTSLALTVEDAMRRSGGQFVFKPFRAMPGQFAEFLVRLDLPAGEYRVTRLFGVAGAAGEQQTAPQFDFPAEQRFAVDGGQAAYLGRIEVTNRLRRHESDTATGPADGSKLTARAGFASGSPRVTAHDESDEDLVSFRTQWSDLRERRIETRLSASFAVPAPQGSASLGVQARFPQPGVPSGEFVTAQPLDVAAAGALPVPLRAAFARFAASKRPRAFAYEPGGAYGAASGGDQVIARALQQCEQRRGQATVGRAGCILFAIDDSVMAGATRPASPAPIATPMPLTLR